MDLLRLAHGKIGERAARRHRPAFTLAQIGSIGFRSEEWGGRQL